MGIAPELYFELGMGELRTVTRFAVVPAEAVLALVPGDAAPDPRPAAAVEAAWRFVRGEARGALQRTTALDAHRAARDAPGPVGHHAAMSAGDAAASAYLHPFAKGNQVGHILRSTAHAACAAEAAADDPEAAEEVLVEAVARATPDLLGVLRRYPPFPEGRSRVARLVRALDDRLREKP